MDKKIRIGIIGAGAAGLSAAEALREKGYQNITVLEKRDRVGGQVKTASYLTPTGKTILYELGTVQPTATSSGALKKLIKRYNLKLGRNALDPNNPKKPIMLKIYNIENKKMYLDFVNYLFGIKLTFKNFFALLHDFFILIKMLWRYRSLANPGYDVTQNKKFNELLLPIDAWINNLNLSIFAEPIKLLFGSILTYSNIDKINDFSGVHAIKLLYCLIKHPPRYVNGTIVQISEGFQELWNRVASANNVKLNVEIKKITRTETGIQVDAQDQSFIFDKIILACTASEALKILDASQIEANFLSKVQYSPGWRGAFTAKGMPHDASYITPFSLFHRNSATLVAFLPAGKIDDETWLFECMMSVDHAHSVEHTPPLQETEKVLKEHFNAQEIKWISTAFWPEFNAHYKGQDIKENIYSMIDKQQGQLGTYYVGEILSCGLNALVSNYSYYIVNKYF